MKRAVIKYSVGSLRLSSEVHDKTMMVRSADYDRLAGEMAAVLDTLESVYLAPEMNDMRAIASVEDQARALLGRHGRLAG